MSAPDHRHVEAGEQIGVSGIGNHVAHLHLGLLLDGQVEQDSWDWILRDDEIRKLFAGYKNGELLPSSLRWALPMRARAGSTRYRNQGSS